MPKIIVTSTFRKGGKGGKNGGAGGLLKYMGTREGVEKLPLGKENKPATRQQQSLIAAVLKKVPDTIQFPEYQKFMELGTKGSAADFLNAVMQREEQAEDIGKLVTYMAERPGVVKLGKHGLFSQTDDPIDLEKAAEEVTNHAGYIWTHVVSLRREDAERLGYKNADAWKSLVRRNVTAIAEAHRIPLTDLQWYAAFHNTGHHPHIHLMVYSKGQEGYLSKQSIDRLRSCFGNDIFKQEQYHLFQLQTGLRQEIKEKSEQKIRDLVSQAETAPQPDAQIHFLLVKLRMQLDKYSGKKVYGYLPKSIKATVNEIVAVLSREPAIAELYKEWNKVNCEKLSLYYENKDPTVPLVDNKEFRSIKNMIIKAVMEMPWELVMRSDEIVQKPPVTILCEENDSANSSSDGNGAAADAPGSTEPERITMDVSASTEYQISAIANGIIGALARLISDKCMAHRQSLQEQIDSKLQAKINEKKQALGLRTERTQKPSYQTQDDYDMSM